MIRTSNYENFKDSLLKTCSISWGKGVEYNYKSKSYMELAPLKSFWRTWKDNIGKIPEDENNKYYIEQYYDLVLSKLDIEKVYRDLDNNILLCYEEGNEFCHRHIVAAWFELLLDVKVPEVVLVDGQIKEVDKPSYIKEILEEIMKKKIDMKGYNSLRAIYLYNESQKFDELAKSIDDKDSKLKQFCNMYKGYASVLRYQAYETEKEYNKNNIVKKRIYKK